MHIVETIKESGCRGLSEHGYAGNPNIPIAPNYSQGKALQTYLSPGGIKSRCVFAAPGNGSHQIYTGDDTPIVTWLDAFDLTTIPWGCYGYALFNSTSGPLDADPSFFAIYRQGVTAPPSGVPIGPFDQPELTGGLIAFNAPMSSSVAVRLPGEFGTFSTYVITEMGLEIGSSPEEYMVVDELGIPAMSIFEAVEGCTSGPFGVDTVIDLPLPPAVYSMATLDGFRGYCFGVVGANNSGVMPNLAADVTAFHNGIVNGAGGSGGYYPMAPGQTPSFGPGWNAGLACRVPDGPPF